MSALPQVPPHGVCFPATELGFGFVRLLVAQCKPQHAPAAINPLKSEEPHNDDPHESARDARKFPKLPAV